MDVTIRAARPGDREHVISLAERLTIGVAPWRDPDAVVTAVRGWLESSLAVTFDGQVFVAECAGSVVGFASVTTTQHFTGEVDGYLGELVVSADAEGHGIGARLVENAEAWASAQGLRCLTLTTGTDNTHAQAFYRRRGYVGEDVKLTKVL